MAPLQSIKQAPPPFDCLQLSGEFNNFLPVLSWFALFIAKVFFFFFNLKQVEMRGPVHYRR